MDAGVNEQCNRLIANQNSLGLLADMMRWTRACSCFAFACLNDRESLALAQVRSSLVLAL